MKSPFPGMDPYLEDKDIWPGVHHLFNALVCTSLNARLPSRYVATVGLRLYLAEPERSIYPDVDVRMKRVMPDDEITRGAVAAVMEADPAMVLVTEDVRESFVEIVVPGEERRVVTAIETLSPANKVAGSTGRGLYRKKQRQVLGGESNLLEIDLLRAGRHTVAAPRDQLASRQTDYDYLVSLSRKASRDRFEVWPFPIRQRLPRVLVPLEGDDPDLVLDLQAILDRCYDDGAFARLIDYSKAPKLRIVDAEDADWAVVLLREKGLMA